MVETKRGKREREGKRKWDENSDNKVFFFQAEDGIRDAQESRGLGDVYKRQLYAMPVQEPTLANRGRTILDRFERDHPEEASALRDLQELTDLMDECAPQECHDPPETYSASSTDGEYAPPTTVSGTAYHRRLDALLAAEATGDTPVLQATAEQRQTDAACLQELIDLVSDGGCTTCPMQSYSEYRHCTLGPDDGDKSERPCRMGWRAWLERRVRSRPCPTEQQ